MAENQVHPTQQGLQEGPGSFTAHSPGAPEKDRSGKKVEKMGDQMIVRKKCEKCGQVEICWWKLQNCVLCGGRLVQIEKEGFGKK